MIHDLAPCSAYRDAGVPWLDRVPAHWEVWRNGRLFRESRRYRLPGAADPGGVAQDRRARAGLRGLHPQVGSFHPETRKLL